MPSIFEHDLPGEPAAASALPLAAILTLEAAAPLAAALLAQRGAALLLDAQAVERLGGQCLQVLLSAALTWATDAQPFAIRNASPEFAAAVEAFGAGAHLLPPGAPA